MPEVVVAFSVRQPIERVWSFLQDVPAVVACVPGMELTGEKAPGLYQGRIGMRIGPIAVAFEGEATIRQVDAAERSAVIEGKGVDKRGGNRATATLTYVVTAEGEATTVSTHSQFTLSGALAQMGRTGIFQDVATELTKQFAQALSARLEAVAPEAATADPATLSAPEQSRALGAGALLRIVLAAWWRRLVGLFRRPAPLRK